MKDHKLKPEQRLENALDDAEFAFWEVVAESFSEAQGGDFPPEASMAFREACEDAIKTWLSFNLTKEP